jgi:hypothetical protein
VECECAIIGTGFPIVDTQNTMKVLYWDCKVSGLGVSSLILSRAHVDLL